MGHEGQQADSHSAPNGIYISVLRSEYLRLHCEHNYWEAQFRGAQDKIEKYKAEIEELKAQNRKLNSRLFGESKSETAKPDNAGDKTGNGPGKKGKRGKKPGTKGTGRKNEDDLPTTGEPRDLPPDQCCCPKCGEEYLPLNETADSEVIEVEVKAHRRVIKRKRYKKRCKCSNIPGIITASPEPKVIPKGKFGVSVLVQFLLYKYYFHLPLNRIVERFALLGLKLSTGTICGNLNHLSKLMLPIYQAIGAYNKSEHHWHADETRWMVFIELKGKSGHRWYLWVFRSETSVYFKIAPTRGAVVAKDHFSDGYGIISVDRYSGYKPLLKTGRYLLAFCWAHVRRDFLEVEKGNKSFSAWSQKWLNLIAAIYHTNNARIELAEGDPKFAPLQTELESQILDLKAKLGAEQILLKDEVSKSRKGVIESMLNHWHGLTLFVRYSWVPMDNNTGERSIRDPVVGRKNYYGSGSEESALCAAESFSIFGTLDLWKLNPSLWLTSYLEACAKNGGKAPGKLDAFLPWKMSLKRLKELGGKEKIKPYSRITKEEIKCATVDEVFLKKKSKSSDKLSALRQSQNTESPSQGKFAEGSIGPGPPVA